MKKLLIVLGLLGSAVYLDAAANVIQPVPSPISVLTAAQILASTPTYAGQVVVCNNCTNAGTNVIPYQLCIGTEAVTAQNGYILVSSAPTVSACK